MSRRTRSRPVAGFAMLTAATMVSALATACNEAPAGGGAGTGDAGGGVGAAIVLDASEVHVFAASDSIASFVDLDVLPDGTVWVLNSVMPFFIGFDADGSVIAMHGREGGGPMEFGAPAGFVRGGIDGDAWIYDRERHAFVAVSRSDGSREEIRVPGSDIPPGSVAGGIGWALAVGSPVRTARLGDELIVPRTAAGADENVSGYWRAIWSADLVAFRPGSDSARDVLALADVLGDPSSEFDLSGTSLPFPLWYRLWAVCGDEVRVFDRLANTVRRFTAGGTELDATSLPPPAVTTIDEQDFARATFDIAVLEVMGSAGERPPELTAADTTRIMQSILSRVDADPAQLANLLPRYTDLRCGSDGTLWLQPFDVESGVLGGGARWLRITQGGEASEVRLPDRFDPYRFTADRIWGVQRDAFDVGTLAWIDVPDRAGLNAN